MIKPDFRLDGIFGSHLPVEFRRQAIATIEPLLAGIAIVAAVSDPANSLKRLLSLYNKRNSLAAVRAVFGFFMMAKSLPFMAKAVNNPCWQRLPIPVHERRRHHQSNSHEVLHVITTTRRNEFGLHFFTTILTPSLLQASPSILYQ